MARRYNDVQFRPLDSWWIGAILFGVAAFSFAQAGDANKKKSGLLQELHVSLKDEGEKRPEWKLVGPNANAYVKHDTTGLRITLPPGMPKERPIPA